MLKGFLKQKWPALIDTGKKGAPFIIHDKDSNPIPIINNIKVAEGLVSKDHKKDIGMIMLYEGSHIKKGVSKRVAKNTACLMSFYLMAIRMLSVLTGTRPSRYGIQKIA